MSRNTRLMACKTIITTALPTIAENFQVSEGDYTWIGSSYLLGAAGKGSLCETAEVTQLTRHSQLLHPSGENSVISLVESLSYSLQTLSSSSAR